MSHYNHDPSRLPSSASQELGLDQYGWPTTPSRKRGVGRVAIAGLLAAGVVAGGLGLNELDKNTPDHPETTLDAAELAEVSTELNGQAQELLDAFVEASAAPDAYVVAAEDGELHMNRHYEAAYSLGEAEVDVQMVARVVDGQLRIGYGTFESTADPNVLGLHSTARRTVGELSLSGPAIQEGPVTNLDQVSDMMTGASVTGFRLESGHADNSGLPGEFLTGNSTEYSIDPATGTVADLQDNRPNHLDTPTVVKSRFQVARDWLQSSWKAARTVITNNPS